MYVCMNDELQTLEMMTDDSQTQQGAGILKPDLLNPESKLRIGCWNVRALYQAGKLKQVVRGMENYKIEVLCVSEARWINSGRRRLLQVTPYSSLVAQITIVQKTILEWKPINDRFLKARFNSKFVKMTVIVCYAPTEDAEEEITDEFYDQLEEAIRTTPQHDMLLEAGDLNARVGMDNTGKERTKYLWLRMVMGMSTIMAKDLLSCVKRPT